jgi:hypothetical protein
MAVLFALLRSSARGDKMHEVFLQHFVCLASSLFHLLLDHFAMPIPYCSRQLLGGDH